MQALIVVLVTEVFAQTAQWSNPAHDGGSFLQQSRSLELTHIDQTLQAQSKQLGELEKVVEKIAGIAQHVTDRVDEVELRLKLVGPAQTALHDEHQRMNATLQANLQAQLAQNLEIAELRGRISQANLLSQRAQQTFKTNTDQVEAKLNSAKKVSEEARNVAVATQQQVAKEFEAAQLEVSLLEHDMQEVMAVSASAQKQITQVSADAQAYAAHVEQETKTALKALLAKEAVTTASSAVQLRAPSRGQQHAQANLPHPESPKDTAQFS